MHLVLARPEGAGPGTKGLSLFIVPKFHFDWETGELGERNGAYVTNVEHKMGLKASTTCELTFGEHEPAVGWLVGEVHDGIAQMFKIIEFARMMVGTKAIATLSTGYLNALDYAKTRAAGPRPHQDDRQGRAAGADHPPPRRAPVADDAEGVRRGHARAGALHRHHPGRRRGGRGRWRRPATRHDLAVRLNDLLLPIVKGFGSEKSYELLGSQSLQTFGGSGYLQDYPIEQYIRDAKIDTLYEGTTAIQGMDFFFRKIVRDKGQALTKLMTDIQEFAKGDEGNGALQAERELLAKALEDVQGIVATMVGSLTASAEDVSNIYKVGQNTTRLLLACGDLVIAWLLLRQAAVALAALDAGATGRDESFYDGKVAAAKFFAGPGAAAAHRPAGRRRERRQRPDGRPRGRLLARSPSSGAFWLVRAGISTATRHSMRCDGGRNAPVCTSCPTADRVVGGVPGSGRGTSGLAAVTRRSAQRLTRAARLTNPGGTMGIGVSIFLIAVGAILAFAVELRRLRPGHRTSSATS